MSSSGKGGKGRYTSRATVPGAVAMDATTEEPDAVGSARPAPHPEAQEVMIGSRKAAPAVEQPVVAAPTPPEEPDSAHVTYAAASATAAAAAPQPQPSSSVPRSGKARRTTPAATTPGAVSVAVAASSIEEPGNISPVTNTSSGSQPSASSSSKGARRSVPATRPGAVADTSEGALPPSPNNNAKNHATSMNSEPPPPVAAVPYGKNRPSSRATTPGVVNVGAQEQNSSPMNDKNVLRTSGVAGSVVVPGAVRMAVTARESSKESTVTSGELQINQATAEQQQQQQRTASYEPPVTATPGAHSVTSTTSQDAAVIHKDPKARHTQRERNAAPVMGATGAAAAVVVVAANSAASDPYSTPTTPTTPRVGVDDPDYLIKMENKVREYGSNMDVRSSRQIRNEHPADVKSPFDMDPAKRPFEPPEQPSVGVIHPPDDTAMITTTAARGMDVPPHLAYGTAGIGNSGYRALMGDDALAVAIAISEEDDDMFLPAAVEFDPDAKPPILKNRRFRLYIIAGTLLFFVIIIVLVLGLVVFGGGSATQVEEAPTSSPTSMLDAMYTNQFAKAMGRDFWDFPDDSPQYRAMTWIMEEDEMKLGWNDTNLPQRYLLAVFYFSTTNNGELQWTSCNPDPSDYNIVDCEYLKMITLADDTVSYTPEPSSRWLSNIHDCEWAGNLCDDVNITRAIDLFGQNITGTIPTELVALPLIQSIALAYNELNGTLPVEFALPDVARHLINIELHGNNLNGSIPEEYYQATGLQNLNVGQNFLTGTLSPDIGRLTNLKGLHTFDNQLSGTLPTEIGKLEYLAFTRHGTNRFNGTIPTELGELALLQEIWLEDNLLTGAIPSEIGRLTALLDIRLLWNKLSGSIPSEIYTMSSLFRLDLSWNLLNGTIASEIGVLAGLSELRLSRNRFTGTIPTEIGNLAQLQLAWFHINFFNGSVPSGACNLPQLLFLQSDCFPVGNAACPCECCTACCDRNTEICLALDR